MSFRRSACASHASFSARTHTRRETLLTIALTWMRHLATVPCASIAPNMSRRERLRSRKRGKLLLLLSTSKRPSHDTNLPESADCSQALNERSSGTPFPKGTYSFAAKQSLEKRRLHMPRVNLVDPATAAGAAKPLLDEIKGAFGTTPNMFRAVANSPAALKHM